MTNDDLRALATHMAEHVTRFEGGDPKEYASYMYNQLVNLRDKTLEQVAEMTEDCADIMDFHRLPAQFRSMKNE